MKKLVATVLCLVLAGCGGPPPPVTKLSRAPARCRVAPAKLPKPAVGQDAVRYASNIAKRYGLEASKLRCMQRYERTITR